MIHYIYRITNVLNGRYYIGARSCICEALKDPYMGSGKLIKLAIKHYGRSNFRKDILEILPDRQTLMNREAELIDPSDPLSYNLCIGGLGGNRWTFHPNPIEYKNRISKSTKQRLSSMTAQQRKDIYGRKGTSNKFYGKSHTEVTKDKLRQALSKYEYLLTSPAGEVFTTISLKEFCQINNLNRDILMKYQNKGPIPSPRNYGFESRMNTVGWSINSRKLAR